MFFIFITWYFYKIAQEIFCSFIFLFPGFFIHKYIIISVLQLSLILRVLDFCYKYSRILVRFEKFGVLF